jgi:hypothetical protein
VVEISQREANVTASCRYSEPGRRGAEPQLYQIRIAR